MMSARCCKRLFSAAARFRDRRLAFTADDIVWRRYGDVVETLSWHLSTSALENLSIGTLGHLNTSAIDNAGLKPAAGGSGSFGLQSRRDQLAHFVGRVQSYKKDTVAARYRFRRRPTSASEFERGKASSLSSLSQRTPHLPFVPNCGGKF